MTDLFGQVLAPVSRSQQPANSVAQQMNGIYGLRSSASSASVALFMCLASRLQERLAMRGSIMWQQTWNAKATPLRRAISAHIQSGLRTSDSGCIGWPTPAVGGENSTDTRWQARRAEVKAKRSNGNGFGLTLGMAASLAAWPTPTKADGASACNATANRSNPDSQHHAGVTLTDAARCAGRATPTTRDWKDGATSLIDAASWATPTACTPNSLRGRGQDPMKRKAQGHAVNLQDQVTMASAWSTPSARDWKDIGPIKSRADGTKRLDQLPRQAHLIGETSSGSLAPTAKPGQLNPRFSGWMMGYPVSWDIVAMAIDLSSRCLSKARKTASPDCADTATPSCPPSPPSS
jgi:hypothetical protein